MNWLRLLPLVILGVANVAIAGAVLARDVKKLNNFVFAIFALSIGSWVAGIAGFLLTRERNAALDWAQLYYAAPLFISVSGMLFALSFPHSGKIKKTILCPLLLSFLILLVPLLFFRSLMLKDLIYHTWGKEVILGRIAYGFYATYIIVFFSATLLVMHLKSRKLQGLYALQAKLFFQGLAITALFGLLFNLILPLFGNYHLIGLGPLFTSISVTAMGYSIIWHKMFDIRLIVARSLGYLATMVALSTAYGFLVFGIARLAFHLYFSIAVQFFLSAATGIAALGFQNFKTRFDEVTNKIFYRDAYNTQAFFDTLNGVLVSTASLDTLLRRTSETVTYYLKAQYCLVGIKDESSPTGQRIIGTTQREFSPEDILAIRKFTPMTRRAVIVTDDIADENSEMHHLLTKNDIAVLVRLTTDYRKSTEGLGYIVLGPKQSGNPYTTQDIGVLQATSNGLLVAIQNALRFREIESFNKTLQQKVVEATNKLRRTNEKLKALDETKDDFISMASHQLRTPLTSVKGYISMVLEEDAGKINKMQREMLGQAFFSSQRMVYLIADLLNVSRLKTGKFVITTNKVSLPEIVQQEIGQLEETAASRSLTLSYDRPKEFPELLLDETKTRQVIMNFVDNAIYYTPSGGHITVRLINNPTTVELRVDDNGIGVPKAEQPHLFTKFYRAGNARQARPDGTGLGLYMAKKVIVAQGGSILFDSTENVGSSFGFIFSKSVVATDPSVNAAPLKVVKPKITQT